MKSANLAYLNIIPNLNENAEQFMAKAEETVVTKL